MSDKDYLIALSTFYPFGPVRTRLLLNYFKSAKNVWTVSKNDLLTVGLSEKIVADFVNHKAKFNIQKYFTDLKKESIKVVTLFEDDYPQNLKEISDAPYVLYVKGDLLHADSRSVAMVGTRMMTNYGREVAEKFARELANFGITVVSGLALGVDAQSQKSALKGGGRTISVLASGLDIISPLANKALAYEIINGKGAIVSEYPMGHKPMPFEFPIRDRLISGLSKAVIVIEGKRKSGTFHTVNAAAEQGRPVFAVPGPITSPTSEGPNYLIQNGAKLITNIHDVLEELSLEFKSNPEIIQKVMPSDSFEEKLTAMLVMEPLHLDELVRISGEKIGEVSARLTIMEMKGLIRNIGGSVYKKI